MSIRMSEIQNLAEAFFTEILMDDVRFRGGGCCCDFCDEWQVAANQSFQIFVDESRKAAMADESCLVGFHKSFADTLFGKRRQRS